MEGKVIEADQYLVEMLGYESLEEFKKIDIGRDLYVDPAERLRLLIEVSTENRTHEFFCKRRNGKPIAVRITWHRVFDDAGNFLYFEGTIQAIPESAKDPNLLRIQYDLAIKLSSTFDLGTTLKEVLNAAMQIEGVDCGGIYLFNDSSQNFELAVSTGFPEWFIQVLSHYSLEAPQTQYIMQGKTLYVTTEEVRLPNRTFFEKDGIKGGAIAPVVHQGQVIATLNLASHTKKTFLLSARRAIEAIAMQVGGSVARAQAETARHISQQNLQSLFDSLNDIIFVMDEGGRLLHANPVVSRRLGYTLAELSKMNVGDLHPPERLQEALNIFSQMVAGQTSICEIPLLAKDGSQIPVETLVACGKWGETDAVFAVARDLSEHHRARLALQESESRFHAIFESAAIGLALGSLQGIMLEVNGTFAKMLGYTTGEIIGKSYADFTHSDDVGVQRTLLRELYEGRRDKIFMEKHYIHKNGGIIWGRLYISLIRDADGAPLYGLGIIENITEHKQAAEAIQKEQQLLRRIIELHERDRQITAYEIHDGVTQQVTAAQLHLEAFRRQRDSDANAAEKSLDIALKLISQSVDETRRLISGLRPLILDEYGIIEAIDYLVCEQRERNDKQIDFQHDVHFKRLVPPLESAVFRIVQEAVANACRHSRSNVVWVELVERDDRLHVKVRDQGVGFNPNSVGETCFGLRSIRERARLLGGRAEIQSEPGSGTCITVELPVVRQAEESE